MKSTDLFFSISPTCTKHLHLCRRRKSKVSHKAFPQLSRKLFLCLYYPRGYKFVINVMINEFGLHLFQFWRPFFIWKATPLQAKHKQKKQEFLKTFSIAFGTKSLLQRVQNKYILYPIILLINLINFGKILRTSQSWSMTKTYIKLKGWNY